MNRILSWFLVSLLLALSGPVQALSMASARGFEKSLYGRSAPTQHKYSYCAGDPVNFSDPSGLESLVYGPGATTRAPNVDLRRVPGNAATAGKVVGAGALLLAIKNPYAVANWYLSNPVGAAATAGGAAYGFMTGDASSPIGEVGALGAKMTTTQIKDAERILEDFGGVRIELLIKEGLVEEGRMGKYVAVTSKDAKMMFNETPTWYQFLHEAFHAVDHRARGWKGFSALTPAQREANVYDMMMQSFGKIMTSDEISHARSQF